MERSTLVVACNVLSIALLSFATAQAETTKKQETVLPPAVKKTFDATFPKAKIEKVDAETENGVEVYDFEFKEGDHEKETDIAADGTLLETTLVIRRKDVPKEAMQAIEKAADGAAMGRTEKIDVFYEMRDGKIIKLHKPALQYAVEVEKNGKHSEVTVDPQGKIVEAPSWNERSEESKK